VRYHVVIFPRARQQLVDQALWWSRNRSPEQAMRWLDGFETALASLANDPERCGLARENQAFEATIRELHYGARGKATHRAVFEVRDNDVLVYAIRHLAQRDVTDRDLS
jgi:plasmid stabilization system protein ParE